MRQDERELFRELYEQYLVPLKKFAVRQGVEFDEIEDLVHETVITYYERYSLELPEKVKTVLLIRILRSKWVDGNRKKRCHKTFSMDAEEANRMVQQELLAIGQPSLSMEQGLIDRELYGEVREIIKGMKKDWRDVLLLRVIEERTTEEICGLLEIPGTVFRSRLSRARNELKKKLKLAGILTH